MNNKDDRSLIYSKIFDLAKEVGDILMIKRDAKDNMFT